MKILDSFDLKADFWELNPQLKIPFKELYKLPDSSKLAWAIALFTDPSSKFTNTEESYRKQLIEEDYLQFKPDWDSLIPYIELYKKLCLSKPKRFLAEWEKKLEQRSQFIASLPYNEENYEVLDKMMSNTEKMWKQYMNCLKSVEEEEAEHTFGGAKESLTEQNVI